MDRRRGEDAREEKEKRKRTRRLRLLPPSRRELRDRPARERARLRHLEPAPHQRLAHCLAKARVRLHDTQVAQVQLSAAFLRFEKSVFSPPSLSTRTRMFSSGRTRSISRTASSAASTSLSVRSSAGTPNASLERRHGAAARFQLGNPATRASWRTLSLGVSRSGERTPCAAALIKPRRVGSARSSKFVPLYINTTTSEGGTSSFSKPFSRPASSATAACRVEFVLQCKQLHQHWCGVRAPRLRS